MARQFETYLCVGGPRSGARIEAHEGGFRVPVIDERSNDKAPWFARVSEPAPVKEVRYVRQDFRTAGTVVFFWRPEDQSSEETLRILLETMIGERAGLTDEERATLARIEDAGYRPGTPRRL